MSINSAIYKKIQQKNEHASFDRWVEQVEEIKRNRTTITRFTQKMAKSWIACYLSWMASFCRGTET